MLQSSAGIKPQAGFLTSRRAAPACLAFLVLFFLSGITASTTVSETSVELSQPLGAVLFSLSSFSVLLLPISIAAMALALFMILAGRRAPALLFAGVSTLLFALFMALYSRETLNNSLYTLL
ncbi:MAG: hypothetical protein LBB86_10020, partial [Oscillospiraceae bacterium]|nr:hypothetical protein [Oscillospiraceae bacterium]